MNKPETIAAHEAANLAEFWARIDKLTSCWWWTSTIDRDGYGRYHLGVGKNIKMVRPHRAVYEMLVGPIAEGMTLDHLCKNRRCVNPEHLEVVTIRENLRRGNGVGARNIAKTHCRLGHPLAGDNLRISSGRRVCRTCKAETQRVRRRSAA